MSSNDLKHTINTMLTSTERPGMADLLQWMDENGFYDAPCSGKYHLAVPGGNAQHAMNVCYNALTIFESFCGDLSPDEYHKKQNSVILCALLHDLGKTGQFGKPNYIPDPETLLYKTNKDLLYVPHEVRSIAIASKYIDLTEEEQFAILHHNGLYGDLGNALKGKETPLQMIIHFADLWASRVTERE